MYSANLPLSKGVVPPVLFVPEGGQILSVGAGAAGGPKDRVQGGALSAVLIREPFQPKKWT